MTTQQHSKVRLPRLGPIAIFLLIVPSFAPEFFLRHGMYYVIRNITSGYIWKSIFTPIHLYPGAPSPGSATTIGLLITTGSLVIIALFLTAARLCSDPEKRLNFILLVAASVIHLLFLLTILTFPASELAHYVVQMGFTFKRILGIAYHCGLLGFMGVYFYWIMRRPKLSQNRFPVEPAHRN